MPGRESTIRVAISDLGSRIPALLEEIQRNLFNQASDALRANTRTFDDYSALSKQMEGEGGGGMANVYWCGSAECETKIRDETKATCRAIPLGQNVAAGKCIVCGESASERAFFAKAY